jgi:Protein of unknown function (DUF2695)
MDKHQRKAAQQRWKDAERAAQLAAMPISPDQLHRLSEYLNGNLKSCDRTTRLTVEFLQVEHLEKDKMLAWLGEHGGYCDCEVLANLADLDESLQTAAPVSQMGIQQKQKRAQRDLQTVTGWNLSNLPAPWRIANLYVDTEPVRLELGKRGGCSIKIVDSRLMSGDQTSDEFWFRLWFARTELPPKGSMQVSHGVLNLPEGYESTLVRSPSWLPVYCWVVPGLSPWCLEVKTDLNRWAGDLPQISSLISHLMRGK